MIRTWAADVSALLAEDVYRKYYMQVPKFRKEKADRLSRKEDKALSIGAWVLFQKMKQEYHLHENVLFNLSHSGEFVLCSVSDEENGAEICEKLGCDLEKIRQPHFHMAKRFFCHSEYERVLKNPDMFYRLWVLKESYLKATREGMKLGMNTFEIGFSKENEPYLIKWPEQFGKTYFFKEYQVEDVPYRIAVCSDRNVFASDLCLVKL